MRLVWMFALFIRWCKHFCTGVCQEAPAYRCAGGATSSFLVVLPALCFTLACESNLYISAHSAVQHVLLQVHIEAKCQVCFSLVFADVPVSVVCTSLC